MPTCCDTQRGYGVRVREVCGGVGVGGGGSLADVREDRGKDVMSKEGREGGRGGGGGEMWEGVKGQRGLCGVWLKC